MSQNMIVCAENLATLESKGQPAFVGKGRFQFGKHLPRQFGSGDVIVYAQRSNATFAYVGVLRQAELDEERRSLVFDRYDPFASPVVAYDEAHEIDRPTLYSPNKGWGPDQFNYIDSTAHQAILLAAADPTEAILWQAISACQHSV